MCGREYLAKGKSGGIVISSRSLQQYYHRIRRLPILTRVFRARYDHIFKTRKANLFRGVYTSMQEAAASAPATQNLGYDQPGPASMYRGRMNEVYPTDYPVLFWLKPLIKSGIRVFDLGGHVGVSFYAYEHYIDFPEDVIWQVCDVPTVVESGEALAQENSKAALIFTTEYDEMDGSDILLASGSLQYIEKNLSEIINGLSDPPNHLLINLLPVHQDHAFVTLQNISTAYCPYRIFKADEFIVSLQKIGYTLKDRWGNPGKACDIPFHEDFSVKPYSGFYFTK